MPTLTLVGKAHAAPADQAVLLDAMRAATAVYNGLVWHLRKEQEESGRCSVTRQALNRILPTLPRAKYLYAHTVQATRDEVISAYRSFFQLRRAGRTRRRAPGFRRRGAYSSLRYAPGHGFWLDGDHLKLSLGVQRPDGVRFVHLRLELRPGASYRRIVNVLVTYDIDAGLRVHLVVDVDAKPARGNRAVAVDLGETYALAAVFDDGRSVLYNGRPIKAIRRYWQKVRARVRPPQAGERMSRRRREITRRETRQVAHLLHAITRDFVARCWEAGVNTIVVGDLAGIREHLDRGRHLNQRLHAWPFARLTAMLRYKAALRGMAVVLASERNTSRRCHGCGQVEAANRIARGWYRCACGWRAQADINAAANLLLQACDVAPLRSSGTVAVPVVRVITPNGPRS